MLRFAIVGGGSRGWHLASLLRGFPDVELAAVCDSDPGALARWCSLGVELFRDFEELLRWGDFDAAVVSTPWAHHARQSIKLLEEGKHVLCEVPACLTLEECWALLDAAKSSGAVYMMGENYCFMREQLAVLRMAEEDVFGDLTYAECGYIHDVRGLLLRPDGGLTWRGEEARRRRGVIYPTHSIGPVAKWMGIGERDEFVELAAMSTRPASIAQYVREVFGGDHPAAREEYWRCGDSAVALISTRRGALVVLRVDIASPRPHNLAYYHLQGTRGAYLSGRWWGEEGLVWIRGVSPGDSLHMSPEPARWEPISKYYDRYEHPLWRSAWRPGIEAHHGGGDYVMLKAFISAAREGREPFINVHDAVTWSAIIPLSEKSIAEGRSVEFPRFR